MVQKLGGAVLGIKWNTETDKFTIPLTVNISNRHRGVPTGLDVTKGTVGILEEATLTRRINLSLTMLLYDPLGFIMPLTIRLKWHSSSWLNRRASQSVDHANQKMWTYLRKQSSSVTWMVAMLPKHLQLTLVTYSLITVVSLKTWQFHFEKGMLFLKAVMPSNLG